MDVLFGASKTQPLFKSITKPEPGYYLREIQLGSDERIKSYTPRMA